MFEEQPSFERMSPMAAKPDPLDPGWGEDLAWLDRDPEREHWLDRLCELDEPDLEDEDEYWDHDDLTAEELAAAANTKLLQVRVRAGA